MDCWSRIPITKPIQQLHVVDNHDLTGQFMTKKRLIGFKTDAIK